MRLALCGALLVLAPATAHAHPYAFGVADWDPGAHAELRLAMPDGVPVPTPVFPGGCAIEETRLERNPRLRVRWRLRCSEGLARPIGFSDLGTLQVHLRVDGGDEALLRRGQAVLEEQGHANFFTSGLRHIAVGWDHLLLCLGLLLVAARAKRRRLRRAAWLLTAFTLGHSISLAIGTWFPVAETLLIEVMVGTSLVLLGRELLVHERQSKATLTLRRPYALAAIFGLVHGLAFATAFDLRSLEGVEQLWALLRFNLGVEAGQLIAVVLAVIVYGAARRVGAEARLLERLGSYAVGVGGVIAVLSLAMP
ncbi:MAG: HupE/UreJ family protein [Myxococcota bacterium]